MPLLLPFLPGVAKGVGYGIDLRLVGVGCGLGIRTRINSDTVEVNAVFGDTVRDVDVVRGVVDAYWEIVDARVLTLHVPEGRFEVIGLGLAGCFCVWLDWSK